MIMKVEKNYSLTEYELKNIQDMLRILNNEFQCHKRKTCLHRIIDDNYKIINNKLNDTDGK